MNRELLIKVRDTIKTKDHFISSDHVELVSAWFRTFTVPRKFNMAFYYGEESCGTVGCIAGFVVTIASGERTRIVSDICLVKAAELLEIDYELASVLFLNSMQPLRFSRYDVTPELAVKAIDRVLLGAKSKTEIWADATVELSDNVLE